jgi:predicted deacylase
MELTRFRYLLTTASLAYWLLTPAVFGKDAFGLDAYKIRAELLTKPEKPYTTKFGNSINVYAVSPVQPTKVKNQHVRFLIQGGLHGNELLASDFVAWLAKRFANGESILNTLNKGNISIDFVPYANPDGTIQYTRYNSNQINLNRNFDVLWGMTRENPGSSPFSENESRAIRDLVISRDYTAAVDVHGFVNWIVLPTSPNEGLKGLPKTTQEQRKKYELWESAVKAETRRQLPGYEIKTAGGLKDGGAFEDFAWWNAGVPAICLELFTDNRHVLMSFADTIIKLLTPKSLDPSNRVAGKHSDTFIVYESYVHSLFQEAIKIESGTDNKNEVVSTK